ncbi:MAG: PD-(D/E)XK nuclease family protein [Bacteroidales bacterium]|nr:PD-(D/E)XK nuclease family protein [Bacteroidales bacterium]
MTPFLKQAARHFFTVDGGISRTCFVFPNRRAMVFFRKYLSEEVAAAGRPLVCPEMLTINDFFYEAAGARPTDRVTLLLTLYDCYKALNPRAESLDEFVFWGDVLLNDFSDVDRYLVDAKGIFTNVSDFKAIQDDFSWMEDGEQRKALRRFTDVFRGMDEDDADSVKGRFLSVWNILYPLYLRFRETLTAEGLSYEGMVYRTLAEKVVSCSAADVLKGRFPMSDRFVFIGLNVLSECEKTVLKKMKDASLAEFCWDYSSDMIKDPANKSSLFMGENLAAFKQAFELDPDGLGTPEINVVSVPSAVGQAKFLSGFISEDTAVVLPDETMLTPVLNSLPPRIRDVNVTMGHPMSSSAFFGFFTALASLQMHLRLKGDEWYFHHTQVWNIFSSGILRQVVDDKGKELIKGIRDGLKYYVPAGEFSGHPLLSLIFTPVVTDPKSNDPGQVRSFALWLKRVVSSVAPLLAKDPPLELDFAKECYNTLNQLSARDLNILPVTFVRLCLQILSSVSVPYNGEPLRGLQIMGPLETRALDFKEVAILSCNEGVFPRRSVSASFIPPELRRGFSLPTYEFQDSVWAYYFYRLIQRADKVWLVYDSRTEGLVTGEESRYIKQLEYHFRIRLNRFVCKAPSDAAPVEDIVKTPEVMEKLSAVQYSPSALNGYLTCPAKFYYSTVERLWKEDEVAEELDQGMIGTVFHEVMRMIYHSAGKVATAGYLEGVLEDRPRIREMVDGEIRKQLRSFEVSGRDLVYSRVIVGYVVQTLRRDVELIGNRDSGGISIIGLEKNLTAEFEGYTLKGKLDRIDSVVPGEVRIVDYKTGKVGDNDVDIDAAKAVGVATKAFASGTSERPAIALQMEIYDILAEEEGYLKGVRAVNSVYSTVRLFTDKVKEVERCREFSDEVRTRLKVLLDEINDPDVPFGRVPDTRVCKNCDFKVICGR